MHPLNGKITFGKDLQNIWAINRIAICTDMLEFYNVCLLSTYTRGDPELRRLFL